MRERLQGEMAAAESALLPWRLLIDEVFAHPEDSQAEETARGDAHQTD